MSKNEKSIFLSQFEAKVEDGPVKFLVLDATYEELSTRNGEKEIVKIELELEELDNSSSNKEVKSINLFVDYTPRGRFYKFVHAAVTALSANSFQPSKLIGLKGEAVLSHYQPEGRDSSFPQINDWVFYERNEKVAEALASYQVEGKEDEFALSDEDINF